MGRAEQVYLPALLPARPAGKGEGEISCAAEKVPSTASVLSRAAAFWTPASDVGPEWGLTGHLESPARHGKKRPRGKRAVCEQISSAHGSRRGHLPAAGPKTNKRGERAVWAEGPKRMKRHGRAGAGGAGGAWQERQQGRAGEGRLLVAASQRVQCMVAVR
ncbi:unnamed protein product [Calypogeia fissa]